MIKVEGARRPDGARRGPAAFFDLLNEGKECVALDFAAPDDVALLRSMIDRADLVVEASRPRVMHALGIDPAAIVRAGTTTWISITGYGRAGPGANRVAFGDDAAVAGGCTVGNPPRFVADAVADPLAGLYAAAAGLAALVGRRGDLVDLALVDAAAYAVGAPDVDAASTGTQVSLAMPRAREARARTAGFGEHTDAIRAEFT